MSGNICVRVALPRRKQTPATIQQGSERVPEKIWMTWNRKKSLAPLGFQIKRIDWQTCITVTIPTELSGLLVTASKNDKFEKQLYLVPTKCTIFNSLKT
jgi:hypothetical protein